MPDRIFHWIQARLSARLPEDYAADVLGDLERGYQARRGTGKRGARALAWYLAQVASPDTFRLVRLLRRRQRVRYSGGQMTLWIDALRQDAGFAIRSARRSLLGSVVLVALLGLGIGTGTAIFAVVDAVLLRPAPYRDADRIVGLGLRVREGMSIPWIFADQADDWRDRADFLDDVALYDQVRMTRLDGGEPERLQVIAAGAGLLDLLGVQPLLGRSFTEADARDGRRLALLIHGYWQRLGGGEDIIGSSLRLDGESFTVVGVLPPAFKFPRMSDASAWLLVDGAGQVGARAVDRPRLVGRLRDGLSLEAAQDRAEVIAAALSAERPAPLGWNISLTPAAGGRASEQVERGLWMLAAAVAGLLLIAFVNAINLLVVQTSSRLGEFRVRFALGASRWRVARQMVTESVLVCLAAGLLGIGVATGLTALLWTLYPETLRWQSMYAFSLGTRGVVFGLSLAALAGLVVGLVPAAQAAREGRRRGHAGGHDRSGRQQHVWRQALVAAGTAFSVLLVAGAMLFGRNFVQLSQVDAGFDVDRLGIVRLTLPEDRYATPVARAAFFDELQARVGALPGVSSSVVVSGILQGAAFAVDASLETEEGVVAGAGQPEFLPAVTVGPGFIDVVGARLIAGRALEDRDIGDRGVVVDEPLARYLWPSGSAVGRRFRTHPGMDWLTVVGVVEDLRLLGPDDRAGAFDLVFPEAVAATGAASELLFRTEEPPATLAPLVARVVRDLDDRLPVEVTPARADISQSLADPRFLTTVLATLGAVAVLLAATGTYGALAYVVSIRRREMGIRMALGEARGSIQRRTLQRGVVWAAAGVAAGLAGALWAGEFVESLLYGVAPNDPLTLALTTGLMLGVSAAACLVPAWRATRVNPLDVLRDE